YFIQLALEGVPYQQLKLIVGSATVGLDLGLSTIAIVPSEGIPRLEVRLGRPGSRRPGHPPAPALYGATAPRQLPGQLRRAGTDQAARQGTPLLETQQAVPGYQAAQGHPQAEAGCPSQKPPWAPFACDRRSGYHGHHRKVVLSHEAATVWPQCGTSRPRHVH